MAAPADLDRTFDVQADCPRFETYVNNLRYELRDRQRTAPVFDGLYMLRPYTTVPQQWLRLRMVVDGHTAIVAMIRMDNLYMVGFRQEGAGARTWEFGMRDPRTGAWENGLLQGSEPLGFHGGYSGGDGMGDLRPGPPPGELMQPDFGLRQLMDSIRGLAAYQGAQQGQPAPPVRLWLRTIVVVIIESIRSQKVCAFVGSLFQTGGGWLEASLILIIKNWDKISECVILSANGHDSPDLYKYMKAKGICSNTFQARQVVAILYRGPANDPAHRNKRSAVDDVLPGLTFVEVFAVVILDMDCASRGDLFGNISVDDGLGPEFLFCRNRAAAQSVGPGELAEVTGPKRAIWGYDEVVFDLDLSHADGVPDMSPDEQISKLAQMVWNTHVRPVEDYNKAKEHVVRGMSGVVKICYAVVTNAVVATVVIELTSGGDGNTALYGSITGATSQFPDKKIKLFDTDWRHAAIMGAAGGQCIKLLRNVLVVQLGSSLKINADMWHRALLPDMSPPDQQVSKGEVTFDAALGGTASKDITGLHGTATVRVTWTRT